MVLQPVLEIGDNVMQQGARNKEKRNTAILKGLL